MTPKTDIALCSIHQVSADSKLARPAVSLQTRSACRWRREATPLELRENVWSIIDPARGVLKIHIALVRRGGRMPL